MSITSSLGSRHGVENPWRPLVVLRLGRPKTAKKARCSYPECGPRHEVPVPLSVPIRFGGACPSELHYPGQPDSTCVQRPGSQALTQKVPDEPAIQTQRELPAVETQGQRTRCTQSLPA